MKVWAGIIVSLCVGLWANISVAECGPILGACKTSNGSYEARLPKAGGKNAPVVLFLHGYGGSGVGAIKRSRVTNIVTDRGYVMLAPNANRRNGTGPRAWNFHPDHDWGRDEATFLRMVIKDAVARFGIDDSRVLIAGFSLGGSMTTYLACNTPDLAAAYAPIAGSIWRPHPTKCDAPVRLFHTHGRGDRTVSLKGREVSPGFRQGDVFYGMDLFRKANHCAKADDTADVTIGAFTRRKWTGCRPGSALELALFDGNHTVPKGWADMVLDWVETPLSSDTN